MKLYKTNAKVIFFIIFFACFYLVSIALKGVYASTLSLFPLLATITLWQALKTYQAIPEKSLFLSVAFIVFLGIVTPDHLALLVIIMVMIAALVIAAVNRTQHTNNGTSFIKQASWPAVFIIAFLYASTLILLVEKDKNIFFHDHIHPFYELSIGHSFRKKLIQSPDLSFQDKKVRYHFISPTLASYCYAMTNSLEGVYFALPLLLLSILLIMLCIFFNAYPTLYAPLYFLLFLPVYFIDYHLCSRIIFFSSSFLLGTIFMVFSLLFFLKKEHLYFIASSGLLLLTKASFFMTLVGGIFLYFLKKQAYKKLLLHCSILLSLFTLGYFLFLSGAHADNLWLLLPSFIIKFSWYNHTPIHLLMLINSLLLLCFLVKTFFTKPSPSSEMLLFVCIGISGLAGSLLITELVECNNEQFYLAALIPIAVVLWQSIKTLPTIKTPLLKVQTYFLLFYILSSLYSSHRWFIKVYHLYRSTQNRQAWDKNFIISYRWINQHLPKHALIFYSKTYEVVDDEVWHEGLRASGFTRSALSSRQMFSEAHYPKGIIMEKEYVNRFALSLIYADLLIEKSKASEEKFNTIITSLKHSTQAIPLSQEHARIQRKCMYWLSGKKDWYRKNKIEQARHELQNNFFKFKEENTSPTDVILMLKKNNITHLVLELGDTPTNFLMQHTKILYKNDTITILEIL